MEGIDNTMKGIPKFAIVEAARTYCDGDVVGLYELLASGQEDFNLNLPDHDIKIGFVRIMVTGSFVRKISCI